MVVSLRTSASRVVLNNRQISVIVPSRRSCQRYFSNTVFKRDSTSAQQQTQQDSETWSWAKYFTKSKSSIPRHNRQPTGRLITSSEQLEQELGPQVYHNGFVERVQYILVLSFLMTMNKEITMTDAIRYEKTREPNSLSDDLVRLFEYLKIDNLNSVKSELTQLFDKLGNSNNDLVTSFVNNFQWNNDQLTKLLNMKNYNLVQDFKFIVTHPSWQVSTLNKINSIFQNATRLRHKGSLFDILQFKTMISLRLIELLVNSNEFLSDKMLFVMLRNFNESGLFHNYSVILYHCLTNDKHLHVPEYLFNELLVYTIQSKKRSEFIKLASLTLNDIPYPKTENSIGREAFNIKIWKLINEKVLNRRNVTTNYVQTFENTYSSDYITDVLEEEDVNMPIFLKKIQLNKNNLIPPNLSNRSWIANLDFTNCLVANFRNFFYQKLKPCKIRVLKENSSNTGKQKHSDENTVVEDLVVSQGSYHKFDTISMGTAITVLKGCLSFQEFELFDLVIGKIIMDSYFLSYDDKIPRLRIKVTNRIEMDRKFLAINNLNFEHLTQQSGSFVNTDIEKIFNLELLNVYLLRVCTRDTDDHDLQKFNWVKNLIETIYIRPITLKYVTEVNNLFVSDRKTFAKRYNNFFNKADIIKLEIFNHLKRNSEKNAESRPRVNEIVVFDKMKQQRKSVLDAAKVDETEKKYNAFDLYVDKDYQIDIATMRNFYRTAKKLKQFDMVEFYENEFFISWESIMKGEETQNYENKDTQTGRGSSLRLNIKKLLSL